MASQLRPPVPRSPLLPAFDPREHTNAPYNIPVLDYHGEFEGLKTTDFVPGRFRPEGSLRSKGEHWFTGRLWENDGPSGRTDVMIGPYGYGMAHADPIRQDERLSGFTGYQSTPFSQQAAQAAAAARQRGADARRRQYEEGVARQGQALNVGEDFTDRYTVPMGSRDYMSPMERRKAVADQQNADRREYLLMRRAYRDAARQGRRRRDPEASMRALEIYQQGREAGHNLSSAYQGQERRQIIQAGMQQSVVEQQESVEQARRQRERNR